MQDEWGAILIAYSLASQRYQNSRGQFSFQDHRFYGWIHRQPIDNNKSAPQKSLLSLSSSTPQENMITFGHFPKYALPSTIPNSSLFTKCRQISSGIYQNSQGQFSFQDHRFYGGGYADSQSKIINRHPKSPSNPFQVPPQENMITFGHFPKYALPSSIPNSSLLTECHYIASGRYQNSQGQVLFQDHRFYRGGYTEGQLTIIMLKSWGIPTPRNRHYQVLANSRLSVTPRIPGYRVLGRP